MSIFDRVSDISGNASGPSLDLVDPSAPYQSASAYPMPTPGASPSGGGLLFASMGLSSISSVLTAIGQSNASKAQGDYEAAIARTNASVAALQSKQALEAGDFAAARETQKITQEEGAIKASQGASGVDVAGGTNALVRASVMGTGATDVLTIKNNAARQAWGYQTEAIEDTFKGQFASLTARSRSDQSLITGGLQAISGPLAIESNYLRWSRYMGGGGGGAADRLPFNVATN